MDKGYENEKFETLKIKSSVAKKFRVFSKNLSKSQTMTLLIMMDFFSENGISPLEDMGPRMEALENRLSILIKKRINGIIAILKNIEKTQTKPTVGMLSALFEQTEPTKEKKLFIEKKVLEERKHLKEGKEGRQFNIKERWK